MTRRHYVRNMKRRVQAALIVEARDYNKSPWPRDGEPNRQLAFYQLAAPNFLARVETTRAINHFNQQWTARKRLAEQPEAERHG